MLAKDFKKKISEIPDDATILVKDNEQKYFFQNIIKEKNNYTMLIASESSEDDEFDPISKFSSESEILNEDKIREEDNFFDNIDEETASK